MAPKVGLQTPAAPPPRAGASVFPALAQAIGKGSPVELARLAQAAERQLPGATKDLVTELKSLTADQLSSLRQAAAGAGCEKLVSQLDALLPKPKVTWDAKAVAGNGAKAPEPARVEAGAGSFAQRWLAAALPPKGEEEGLCLSTLEKPMTPKALCAAAFGIPAEKVTSAQLSVLERQNPALQRELLGSAPIPAGTVVSLATTPGGLALRGAAVKDRLSTLDGAMKPLDATGQLHALGVKGALQSEQGAVEEAAKSPFEQAVDLANAAAMHGDVKGQKAALQGALGKALGVGEGQVKAFLSPSGEKQLNTDGTEHQWYQLGSFFSTHKVGFLSADQVKGFTEAVAKLPAAQQEEAYDALARYADASGGEGNVGDLNSAKQLLEASAAKTGRADLKVYSQLSEGQLWLSTGNGAAAVKAYQGAAAQAASLKEPAKQALTSQAVMGQASALANVAQSGGHEEKKKAAEDLRALRTAMEKPGAPLDKDGAARLTLLEMNAYLTADESEGAQASMQHLQTYAKDVPWVKQSLEGFQKEHQKGGVTAFLQVALHEANSESSGEALAVGLGGTAAGAAAGAAVGALFFGVGAIPGAFLGAMIGGGVSTAALKTRNLIRGAHQISQAARTGYDAQTWKDSALDATALALDAASLAAPVKGLGSVGKVGLTALSGIGSEAMKTEASALMKGLAARVEQATFKSAGEAGLKSLTKAETERMAKEMLFREISQETGKFGGKWLSRATVASMAMPLAAELYRIETGNLSPEQKSEAKQELLRHFAQLAVTTAFTMGPMIALGRSAALPTAATPQMRQALLELAPSGGTIRTVNSEEFQHFVADRQGLSMRPDLPESTRAQLSARYQAIGEKGVGAFDPVTGNVVVNESVLARPDAASVLAHELTHQQMHALPVAQREGVVNAFTQSPGWGQIKSRFAGAHPEAKGFTDAQMVDEVLAEVHGEPSSALAKLAKPVLETKALKDAHLDQPPKVDLTALKAGGVAPLSDKTYFNRSGETALVGFSDADPPGLATAEILKTTPGNFANLKTFTDAQVQGGKVTFNTGAIRVNGNAAAHGGTPQQVTIEVPPSHRGMRLADIELTHQQILGEKTKPWSGSKDQRDETAAYSQVEVYVKGKGWNPLGQPKKFAEARPEVERLHDLPDPGGEIVAVRVKNVGVDPVHVHGVALHFLPPKPQVFEELALTPGLAFGDPWGGRPPAVARLREPNVTGTRYPNAITMNNTGDWGVTPQATLDRIKAKGWTLDRDTLTIPLDAGKRFKMAEVAIGDTHPDPKVNADGSYGYKGFAKLNMSIQKADGTRISLTNNENIPPQGVLVGSSDYVAKPGDRLLINVSADTAGLMGVRVGYDNAPAPAPAAVATPAVAEPRPAPVSPATVESRPAVPSPVAAEVRPAVSPAVPADPFAPRSAAGKTFTMLNRPAGGSQGGRWYQDEAGAVFFGKNNNRDQTRVAAESLSLDLYDLMGADTPDHTLTRVGGVPTLMSKEVAGRQTRSPADIIATDAKEGFPQDAWLANWDTFGSDFSNIIADANGHAHRIDTGGALYWRARGAHKDLPPVVSELQTLRDPRNSGGQVLGSVSDAQTAGMLRRFALRYRQVGDQVAQKIDSSGLPVETKTQLKKDLAARAEWMSTTGISQHEASGAAQLGGDRARLNAEEVKGLLGEKGWAQSLAQAKAMRSNPATASQVASLSDEELAAANKWLEMGKPADPLYAPLTELAQAGLAKAPGLAKPAFLDPARPPEPQVQQLIAARLGRAPEDVVVTRPELGRSGDDVFLLHDKAGKSLGVFKVFHHPDMADREVQMLQKLADKGLRQFTPVGAHGLVPIDASGTPEKGLLMEMAEGKPVAQRLEELPPAGPARIDSLNQLSTDVSQVANGLAEMHEAFTTGNPPEVQPKAERQSNVDHVLSKLDGLPKTDDLAKVREALTARVFPDFVEKAELPATAWHGDANLGNFTTSAKDAPPGIYDVSTMASSFDGSGKVRGSGGSDVGRFIESMISWPGKDGAPLLSPAEGQALQERFLAKYTQASGLPAEKLAPAILFSRAEYELAAYRFAKNPAEAQAAMGRLKGLLGIS